MKTGFFFFDDTARTWPPPPRAPLPSWPASTTDQPPPPQASCWTHDPTPTALAMTPPPVPAIDFHRGNFCGVRVPGLPPLPGNPPEFAMTWFVYLYSPADQDRYFDYYANVCGYTHIDFHRAAWTGDIDGVPGCSIADARAICAKAKSYGLYVIVNMAVDGSPSQAEMQPWFDALAGVMDIDCLAWQADHLLSPLALCDYAAWAIPYCVSKGIKTAFHWVNGACAWWDDATCEKYGVCNRFTFQTWVAQLGLNYQYQQFNTEGPIYDDRPRTGGLRVEIEEVLKSLAPSVQLVVAEYDAQAEFDQPLERLELYGDQKGRWLLASSYQGRSVTGGYLNGARREDGRVL